MSSWPKRDIEVKICRFKRLGLRNRKCSCFTNYEAVSGFRAPDRIAIVFLAGTVLFLCFRAWSVPKSFRNTATTGARRIVLTVMPLGILYVLAELLPPWGESASEG